jgi:NAD-dependent DNA ligase
VPTTAEDLTLTGQSFCLTGALTIPRKMAETLVRQHGGEIKTTVNKTLTYLVINDPTTKTTKNVKAMELGVNVISEKTFFSLVKYELPESLKIIASINDSMKKNKNKIVKDSIEDL